jgi:membrane associated rhomboid family serine protease
MYNKHKRDIQMIPISDDTPRRSKPIFTWVIVLVNAAVWLYMLFLPPGALNQFILSAAIIPSRITHSPDIAALFTLVSSMFLHGSWQHIIGNMLYLAVFGDNIEDRFGHTLYLVFYLGGGIVAAMAQILFIPTSETPVLGASGAIAAVLGAYLVLYPRQRVRSLLILFVFIRVVTLPAALVLGVWFVLQLFNGAAAVVSMSGGGTAWFAHIGGFVFGLLAGLVARAATGRQAAFYRSE